VMNEQGEQCTFGLLSLDTWNAYISYNNAAKAFEKAAMAENMLPIFRIGTRGELLNGEIIPKVKNFNGGSFTEIEPLDLNKVKTFEVTPDFDTLWEASQPWANCERWNASGKVLEEVAVVPEPEELPEFMHD